jgi:sugar/nucleoside kinase (ribokinase family)
MQSSGKDLIIVGTVAFDTIKTPFGSVKKALGGSAVYCATAARFFCQPHIVGVVGKDFPEAHLNWLKRLGIQVDGLEIKRGKTFHWKGYYAKNLNQAFTVRTDLNVLLEFDPRLHERHQAAPFLFLANIDPRLQMSVLKQVKRPVWTACDTMNFWIDSAKKPLTEVLKKVDISLMNDAEIQQFTGESNVIKAAAALRKIGPKIVVVKRGEHGAAVFMPGGHFVMPAIMLDKLSDPTGAGDSFAGAFLGYLTRFKRPKAVHVRKAMLYGALVASFNVQSFTINRLSKLSIKDIQIRKREYLSCLVN